LTKLRERFPKIGRTADEAAGKVAGWWQRISRQRKAD